MKAMMIRVTCGSCGKTLTVKDSNAGKRGKCPDCGAAISVPELIATPPREPDVPDPFIAIAPNTGSSKGSVGGSPVSIFGNAMTGLFEPVPASHNVETKRAAFRFPFSFFESADDKRARLLAIEEKARAAELARIAKKVARREGWKQFWFNLRLTICLLVGLPIVLIIILVIVGIFMPHSGSSYSSSSPPSTQPAMSTVSPTKHQAKDDGNYKESFVEKIYEKSTGKEVVHKKNGTIYERKQRPK